jgi:hypothetical protein
MIASMSKWHLKRNEGINTCFTDCVAYVLKRDSKKTPFFISWGRDWWQKTKRWLKRQGYDVRCYTYDKRHITNQRKLYIVQGLSMRSKALRSSKPHGNQLHHAVVWKGNKPHFDPSPRKRFLKGRPHYIFVFKKITSPL